VENTPGGYGIASLHNNYKQLIKKEFNPKVA
jgi:hypothetical protein